MTIGVVVVTFVGRAKGRRQAVLRVRLHARGTPTQAVAWVLVRPSALKTHAT